VIFKAVYFSTILGPRFFLRLLFFRFIPPMFYWIIPHALSLIRRMLVLRSFLGSPLDLWYLGRNKKKFIDDTLTGVPLEELGFSKEDLDRLNKAVKEEVVTIARIGQDGWWLPVFAPCKGGLFRNADFFSERTRYVIEVVGTSKGAFIRKNFRGNKVAFINEIYSWVVVKRAGCRVPEIVDYDVKSFTLILTLVMGESYQERLANRGALIRHWELRQESFYKSMSSENKFRHYVGEGLEFISSVSDSPILDDFYSQLRKMHASRISYTDIHYGNILIEKKTEIPYLVDFHGCWRYPPLGPMVFGAVRDCDIEKYNILFGRSELTRERIVKHLNDSPDFNRSVFYSSAYIGHGVSVGDLADVNIGFGKFEFILNRALPPFKGKKVLSLGANCGAIELELLRRGASEVVCIENNPLYIRQGLMLHQAFEWSDNRSYSLSLLHREMKEIDDLFYGKFDLVLALCSLYYLSEKDMVEVVRKLSGMTQVLVLQCNERRGIGRDNADDYRRASLLFSKTLLESNGFPDISIFQPRGYSRPVLVARTGR
jgi:serine/threonine protein kinase